MTTQTALSGAGSGAVAGSAFGPWGALIGGGIGLAGGLLGGQAAGATGHDLRDLAKRNAQYQAEENAKNRAFAEHLLDISHPQMSGTDLGNLLFSQGEGEATRQHDINLATVLRQNLRAGSPLSIGDVTGGFDRQNSNAWADRKSSATLQGLLGVLPGASAINAAGGLGRGIAPQLDPSTYSTGTMLSNYAGANTLASIAPSLQALVGLFSGQGGGQQSQPNPGFGNVY
jgi:hypothetical protein